MPRGVHGSGAGSLRTTYQVHRVQAVGVLTRVEPLQRGVLVEMLGQRQLHDVAGALRVGVQLVDGLVELGLADVGGQITADRI